MWNILEFSQLLGCPVLAVHESAVRELAPRSAAHHAVEQHGQTTGGGASLQSVHVSMFSCIFDVFGQRVIPPPPIITRNSPLQKLKANCQKRLEDLRNPKAATAKVSKGMGVNLTPDDIILQMERLREKVEAEQDPSERDRICARIQGLHSSWQALTGEKEPSAARGAAGGKNLAAFLEEELQKHTKELKEVLSREQTERAAVEDLRAKIVESQPAIDRLRQEREVCLTVVRQLRDKTTEINADYSEQFETFKAAMAEWKVTMDKVMTERCVHFRSLLPQAGPSTIMFGSAMSRIASDGHPLAGIAGLQGFLFETERIVCDNYVHKVAKQAATRSFLQLCPIG